MTDIAQVDPSLLEKTISLSEEQVKDEVNEDNTEKKSIFYCDFCDVRRVSYVAFHNHVVRTHNFRPCKFCHFYADSLSNLNFHQETQHCIDPFSPGTGGDCFVCDAEFDSNQGLKSHFEAEHKGVRFSCEQCDYKSSYKTSLKLHIRVKHEVPVIGSPEPGEIVRDSEGQIVGDSLLKTEVEEDVISQDLAQEENIKLSLQKKTARRKITQLLLQKYPQFQEFQEGEEDEKKDLKPGQAAHQRDENNLIWCQYADCNFRSKYITNVIRHEQAQHKGLRFQCDKCPFTAKQKSEVLTHSNTKHEGLIYNCDCCDFKTPWKSYFKKHQIEKHGASISFKKREAPPARQAKVQTGRNCPQCDFSSTNKMSVRYHKKKSIEGRLFTCRHCEYRNCLERSLLKHELKSHGIKPTKEMDSFKLNKKIKGKSESWRKCHQCDFSSAQMQYHNRKSIPGRFFTCRHCEYRNCLKRSLLKHELKSHGIKPNKKTDSFNLNKKIKGKCPKCDFISWNNKVLDFHIQQSKISEEIHLCNLCDYKNCSKQRLKNHKVKKHKETKPVVIQVQAQFKCSKCEKKYKTLHGLKIHKSICLNLTQLEPLEVEETPDSPIEKFCDKCDYKTSDNDDYYDHVLEHLPSNTSQPQKLTNSVGNNLNPIKDEEPEIPPQISVQEDLPVNSGPAGQKITAFKDKLKNKLNELSEGESQRALEDESLEPGEIIRDSDGQILGNSPLKTEDDAQVLPPDTRKPSQTKPEPGEIVRDIRGEIVGDSCLKPELEELDHSQDQAQVHPQAPGRLSNCETESAMDSEEVESAVGFLISLNQPEQEDLSGDVKEEYNLATTATRADDDNTDYSFGPEEFKCDFACGHSFSSEEDLYIHITDQHNF